MQKNPFNHKSKRDGGIFEFEYSFSNDNLVKGETFERDVLERFKNLMIFSICFPCTPYLLKDGKLLFSNGDHQSWAVRFGEMKNEEGPSVENIMEEDYDYVEDPKRAPDFSEPFQVARIGRYKLVGDGGCDMFVFLSFSKEEGGFLIPVQCKYRSNENMQLYDPNDKYGGGTKTLNHYLSDFDSLLERMVLDKKETNYSVRYGLYIVSSNVNIPEKFPRTKNVIMVIHDFDITVENIRTFFNRVRSRNHNAKLNMIETRRSSANENDTLLNSTDRSILISQTDIIEKKLNKCANDNYWMKNKINLITMMRDTISELRTCLRDSQADRQTTRYTRELRERRNKYYSLDRFGIKNDEITEREDVSQHGAFDMSDLNDALNQTVEEQFDIYKIIASLSKK